MAHKTLIGGTAYDIAGGKTLVDGTSYSVKNGKVLIDGTAYTISFVLPPALMTLWSYATPNSYGNSQIFSITYAEGFWVAGGTYYDGSTYFARIAYATSLAGPWTIKDLWEGSSSAYVRDIAYANGYWVAAGKQKGSTVNHYARIAYATTPDSTWTTKDVWSSNSSCYCMCVAYGNGYWVVGGQYSSGGNYYGAIAYSTSPGGTWTKKNLWGDTTDVTASTYNYVNCITYANSRWVAGGAYYYSSTCHARIGSATSPSGTWSFYTIWSGTSSGGRGNKINSVTYANGYWAVGGVERTSATPYKANIAYSTSLGGTWTKVTLWSGNSSCSIDCITYANGYWACCGENKGTSARIAYSDAIDGTWTQSSIYVGISEQCRCILHENGYWVVAGGHNVSTSGLNNAVVGYAGSLPDLTDI